MAKTKTRKPRKQRSPAEYSRRGKRHIEAPPVAPPPGGNFAPAEVEEISGNVQFFRAAMNVMSSAWGAYQDFAWQLWGKLSLSI